MPAPITATAPSSTVNPVVQTPALNLESMVTSLKIDRKKLDQELGRLKITPDRIGNLSIDTFGRIIETSTDDKGKTNTKFIGSSYTQMGRNARMENTPELSKIIHARADQLAKASAAANKEKLKAEADLAAHVAADKKAKELDKKAANEAKDKFIAVDNNKFSITEGPTANFHVKIKDTEGETVTLSAPQSIVPFTQGHVTLSIKDAKGKTEYKHDFKPEQIKVLDAKGGSGPDSFIIDYKNVYSKIDGGEGKDSLRIVQPIGPTSGAEVTNVEKVTLEAQATNYSKYAADSVPAVVINGNLETTNKALNSYSVWENGKATNLGVSFIQPNSYTAGSQTAAHAVVNNKTVILTGDGNLGHMEVQTTSTTVETPKKPGFFNRHFGSMPSDTPNAKPKNAEDLKTAKLKKLDETEAKQKEKINTIQTQIEAKEKDASKAYESNDTKAMKKAIDGLTELMNKLLAEKVKQNKLIEENAKIRKNLEAKPIEKK